MQLFTVFAGQVPDGNKIEAFLMQCQKDGAGMIVGAYMGDTNLLMLKDLAQQLGLVLLMPASGLPEIPAPRSGVFRFWPNDKYQAKVLVHQIKQQKASKVVVLSGDDVNGQALIAELSKTIKTDTRVSFQIPPVLYNDSSARSNFSHQLETIRKAVSSLQTSETAVFVCNCGPYDISPILDAMRAESSKWKIDSLRLLLTDRSTPTRSVVADKQRQAFAAQLHTSGVLSHIQSASNPE